MNITFVLIYILSVFISSVSQILLKQSANIKYESRIREYLNVRVIVAYGIFFLATLITILAYKKIPLSLGPVLETTGYFFVAVLSRIILKEHIGKRKIIGILVVIVGIVVSCL